MELGKVLSKRYCGAVKKTPPVSGFKTNVPVGAALAYSPLFFLSAARAATAFGSIRTDLRQQRTGPTTDH